MSVPKRRRSAEASVGRSVPIVASVGTTSTMLVISNEQPFGRFVYAHASHRRAAELQRTGSTIEILGEHELLIRVAAD